MRLLYLIYLSFFSFTASSATVEEEFRTILDEDNRALAQIAKIIDRNPELLKSDSARRDLMATDIRSHLNRVRNLYQAFLKKHPNHTQARVAYGSFLTHLDDRKGAENQWRKALDNDPSNAAALNNIATHIGAIALQNKITTRIPEAFSALDKAIKLAPKEPLYRHNLATTLSLYRSLAAKHYNKSEQQITRQALAQLEKALKLAPGNFEIAADLAETMYDLKPIPLKRAITAWNHAWQLTQVQAQRDWTLLQRAVLLGSHNRLDEAENMLDAMSGQSHGELTKKTRQAIAARRRAD